MLKRLKSEKGFTLLEAIISIATLAVVSGFILQMFIVSDDVNKNARDVDISSATAMNTIELFKSQTNPNDYIEDDFFTGCYINANESDINIYKCYSEEWEQVNVDKDSFDFNALPIEIVYVLHTIIKAEEVQGPDSYLIADTMGEVSKSTGTGRMYTIHTTINRYEQTNQSTEIARAKEIVRTKEIVTLKATKYFAN